MTSDSIALPPVEQMRQDSINFIMETDKIWPPDVTSSNDLKVKRFLKRLRATLERLPQDIFDVVEQTVSFIIDTGALAINVPVPASDRGQTNIIIYERSLSFSEAALVGLCAHEIAHSIIEYPDHRINEELADRKVMEWGFSEELEALEREKKILYVTSNSEGK